MSEIKKHLKSRALNPESDINELRRVALLAISFMPDVSELPVTKEQYGTSPVNEQSKKDEDHAGAGCHAPPDA